MSWTKEDIAKKLAEATNSEDIATLKDVYKRLEKPPAHNYSIKDKFEKAKDLEMDISITYDVLFSDFKYFYKMAKKNDITLDNLKKVELTDDDLLTLTHDFYKSLNPYFYKTFLEIFKDRKYNLAFYPALNGIDGVTFALTNHKQYIAISRHNDYNDYPTLVHEYAHTIRKVINPKRETEKFIYYEIESIFMEMLAHDYYKKIEKDIPIVYKACYHNTIINYVKAIFDNKELTHLLYKSEDEEKIIDFYNNSKANMASYTLGKYITGYMYATELYNMYKRNKEKALENLKQIFLASDLTDIEYYEYFKTLGLIPNKGLKKYQKSLTKEIKTLKNHL